MGISRDLSSHAQRIAQVPEEEYEEIVARIRQRKAEDDARLSPVVQLRRITDPARFPYIRPSTARQTLRRLLDEIRRRRGKGDNPAVILRWVECEIENEIEP